MVTMAIWGLNLSAVKILTADVETLVLASLRMALATVTITAFAGGRLSTLLSLSRWQLLRLVTCAGLMVYGNQLLMLSGMRLSSATNASLIVALSPLVAIVVAAVTLREPLRRQMMTGVLIGFCGVSAVVLARPGAGFSTGSLGDLLLLLSVVSFSIGGALVQRLAADLDTSVISWAVHALGSVMLIAHSFVAHPTALQFLPHWSLYFWIILIFSGAVATGLGNLVWNRSISAIGVSKTTAALYWVPVFGIAFAVVALGETASWWHPFGLGGVSEFLCSRR